LTELFERVVFIIGAGHSCSANGPTTAALTGAIVDRDASHHVEQSSLLCRPEQIAILRKTYEHLATSGEAPTYESIFTWLWTAYFARDPTMYRGAWHTPDPFDQIDLPRSEAQTAYEALRCIEEGVTQGLADDGFNLANAPKLTIEARHDPTVNRLTFITLNHDRLLERLHGDEHGLSDGFAAEEGGLGAWRSERPDTRGWNERVQLIKLHGSIDWWSPEGWGDGGIVYRSLGHPGRRCAELPLLLVGTGPKLFQSSTLMFARQILDAGRSLAEATCVVAVGYSFGDVRMNSLWEGSVKRHKAPTLIISPRADSLAERVKAMTRTKSLAELLDNDAQVGCIARPAEAVDWSTCRNALEKLSRT
jgi:hypothetical protein